MTLTPSNLFHTPDDLNELMDWLDQHDVEARVHLYTAAMMAWNLATKLTASSETDEEVK